MIGRPYQNLWGRVKVGDNTKIGAFVDIGDGVVIGENCVIECFVSIPPGWIIGNNVFIGPHVAFANDKYPKAGKREFIPKQGLVRYGASIGMGAKIGAGLIIGTEAVIGMGAVVTKDVPAGETWVGCPAKKI